jgi:AcrR family transcriptional regulator
MNILCSQYGIVGNELMEKKLPAKMKSVNGDDAISRIFKQGMKLFLRKGYHATSVEEITEAAGCSKGAFYWHFKSKEEFLRRILQEYEERRLDGMIQAVKQTEGGVIQKIKKIERFNLAFVYYNQELCVSFVTLSAELIGSHDSVEPEIRRIVKKEEDFLADLIVEGKRENIFRKELDPHLASLSLKAFQDATLTRWYRDRDRIDGKSFIATSGDIYLEGLMSRNGI